MLATLKDIKLRSVLTVEFLHFFTGICLVACGGIAYFAEGLSMGLSWSIFGAMYISMSDIGEAEMTTVKKSSKRHLIRQMFAWLGACLAILLLMYYLAQN